MSSDTGSSEFSMNDFKGPEYSPFNESLDQLVPVDGLVGSETRGTIISGGVERMAWVSIFSRSPANNAEAEGIMGDMVVASFRAGQWVDMPIKPDEPITSRVFTMGDGKEIPLFEDAKWDFTQGAEELVKAGLATIVTVDRNERWVKPTEKMVGFIADRLKPFYK